MILLHDCGCNDKCACECNSTMIIIYASALKTVEYEKVSHAATQVHNDKHLLQCYVRLNDISTLSSRHDATKAL